MKGLLGLYFGLLFAHFCYSSVLNVIQSNPNFSILNTAIVGCSNCLPYTNPQGILNTEAGNFFAVGNNGASALGAVDDTRLGRWFLSNVTLQRPDVPVLLSRISNDIVLPTRTGDKIRFNVYGSAVAANGVTIDSETSLTNPNQILWTTNSTFVNILTDIPVFAMISGDGTLSSFSTAIVQADPSITAVLGNTATATTVFAPTDSAFSPVNTALYNRFDLFANAAKIPVRARLTRFVNYHLVNTTFWQIGLSAGSYNTLGSVGSFNVNGLTITDSQGRNVPITQTDLKPNNGVLHKVGSVLFPEPLPTFATTLTDWNSWAPSLGLSNYNNFLTFAQQGSPSFYDQYLANTSATGYTFIGPTVFSTIPSVQFINHLIPGVYFSNQLRNDMVVPTVGGSTIRFNLYESWYVNGRPLNNAHMDWVTVNGAFHVYSSTASGAIPFFTQTVWDKIPAAHPFKASLQTAGLATLLQSPGAFTVLLPSQTAWAAVVNPSLDLIKYHIVTSTIFKFNPGLYPTLQGNNVNCSVLGFNGISVQAYDVVSYGATNGMVVPLGGVLANPAPAQTTASVTTGAGGPQSTTASVSTTASGVTGSVVTTDVAPQTTAASQAGTTAGAITGSAASISFSLFILFFAIILTMF